jgi:hypothetical protein
MLDRLHGAPESPAAGAPQPVDASPAQLAWEVTLLATQAMAARLDADPRRAAEQARIAWTQWERTDATITAAATPQQRWEALAACIDLHAFTLTTGSPVGLSGVGGARYLRSLAAMVYVVHGRLSHQRRQSSRRKP